jgi:bacteriocin biosynthesis cyclodehydratase domain-containing protein
MLRRLGDNRPPDLAALRYGARFPLVPPQGLPETFDLAGAWIAAAVAAIAAGSSPPALVGGVLTLDPWTLETRRHPIAICRASAVPAVSDLADECTPIELAANPKRYTADGGHRICPPHETLARLEPFVGPIAGIVPDIEKVPTPEGMHVYAATQIFGGEPTDLRVNRVLGRPSGACGKGASDLQAKVSCLAEAVERYSCGYFGDEPRRQARIDLLGEPALNPPDLLQFSEAQYRDRETTNAVNGRGYNWVPAPFDTGREIDWTPAWSLTFQRTVWLPSAFCYFRYPVPADHEFCVADSNGCAAGNTLEEAILQGFLELVERDACALWWYNRLCRPGIDLASFNHPFFDAMVAQSDCYGRELVALDLTSELGIPVVMAISWRRSDGGRIHLGLGSHLEPRLAVSRALAELNQSAAFDLPNPKDAAQDQAIDANHRRWLREATAENQSYLHPAPGSLKPASEFRDRSTCDLRDDIVSCVEQLSQQSLEMIVVQHTRPGIGFPVARVVVPGLRHFWQRLAPGRLYDVPVTLGWLQRPLTEPELNPIPFFF